MGILTELKNRGVDDILIACVDGLSGFEEAITPVYAIALVQLCLVHQVRNVLKYVTWKDPQGGGNRRADDLPVRYGSSAEMMLDRRAQEQASRYPMIAARSGRTFTPHLTKGTA